MAAFILTPIALQTLRDIAFYTQERWGFQQCATYLKKLDDCFHDLARHPAMGKLRSDIDPDVRSFPAGTHVVFYIIEDSRVIILNVLHEKMDPSMHL